MSILGNNTPFQARKLTSRKAIAAQGSLAQTPYASGELHRSSTGQGGPPNTSTSPVGAGQPPSQAAPGSRPLGHAGGWAPQSKGGLSAMQTRVPNQGGVRPLGTQQPAPQPERQPERPMSSQAAGTWMEAQQQQGQLAGQGLWRQQGGTQPAQSPSFMQGESYMDLRNRSIRDAMMAHQTAQASLPDSYSARVPMEPGEEWGGEAVPGTTTRQEVGPKAMPGSPYSQPTGYQPAPTRTYDPPDLGPDTRQALISATVEEDGYHGETGTTSSGTEEARLGEGSLQDEEQVRHHNAGNAAESQQKSNTEAGTGYAGPLAGRDSVDNLANDLGIPPAQVQELLSQGYEFHEGTDGKILVGKMVPHNPDDPNSASYFDYDFWEDFQQTGPYSNVSKDYPKQEEKSAWETWLEELRNQEVPQFDDAAFEQSRQAMNDRAQMMNAKRMAAMQGMMANQRVSGSAGIGQMGQAVHEGNVEQQANDAKFGLQAHVQNFQAQMQHYQNNISALKMAVQQAANEQDRAAALEQLKIQMQLSEETQRRLLEYQNELNNQVTWKDAVGGIFSLGGSALGGWLGK